MAGIDDETVYKIMRGNAIRMLHLDLAAVDRLTLIPEVVAEAAAPLRRHAGVRRRGRHPAHLRRARPAQRRGRRRRCGAQGVGEGAVVALTLPSTTAYVVAYLGAAKVGAVTAGVNPRLTAPERRACLDVVDPAVVISTADEVERLVADGDGPGRPDAAARPRPRRSCVVFTSGTTGQPKGAMFTEPPAGRDHPHRRRPTAWGDGAPRRCWPARSSPTSAS